MRVSTELTASVTTSGAWARQTTNCNMQPHLMSCDGTQQSSPMPLGISSFNHPCLSPVRDRDSRFFGSSRASRSVRGQSLTCRCRRPDRIWRRSMADSAQDSMVMVCLGCQSHRRQGLQDVVHQKISPLPSPLTHRLVQEGLQVEATRAMQAQAHQALGRGRRGGPQRAQRARIHVGQR